MTPKDSRVEIKDSTFSVEHRVGFELLPAKFTLTELQRVHEAILGESLDKRNFRRKITQKGIVNPLNEWLRTGRKPARLYRFSTQE